MLAKITSTPVVGLDAVPITVEVDVAFQGLPSFTIVGLPDKAVEESKERVVYIMELDKKDVPNLVAKLSIMQGIAVYPMSSWKERKKDIHVTHELATKQHSLEVLLNIINVEKEDVVSVGDSENDIHLFRVSSYKVAMGNATEKLKKEVDLVVDSVFKDGLAKFIETRLL